MANFTENGLQIDGLSAIRQKFINKAKEKFADILNGQELSTDDSGVIGRIFGIVAEPIALQEEALQASNSSLDPNQASGQALDNLVGLTGMSRLDSSPASAFLLVFGEIGTVIPFGASVKSIQTGDVFNLDSSVTFSNIGCNGVEVSPNVDGTVKEYTIQYSIDNNYSENAPITIYSLITDDKKSLAQRLAQTVNSQTSDLYASVTTDNNVNIYIKRRLDTGVFNVAGDLQLTRSYMPVEATSASFTAIGQDAFTITNIQNGATLGWISVTNPYVSVPSVPVESDSNLRYRWKISKGYDSYGNYESLYGTLLMVKGVQFINIQQNITSISNGSRTNQGISVVVLGGNGQEIANAIFKNLPIGTVTDGTEIYYVTDINGGQHEVRFSRPSFVPIKISMSLKALPNFPTSGKNQIKQAIVDWFNDLDVGEDIYYSRLFEPINSIQGFTVKNLKIAKLNGGVLGSDDITIKYNELATITPADILIGE